MEPYLSVIVPCYNEERRITKTLGIIYKYLLSKDFSWEIVVVVSGSTDATALRSKEFAKDKKNIKISELRENRGKGYAVRRGMLEAAGAVRLFTDADNSTDISHFDKMKPLFERGCEVVICSRDPKDAPGAVQAKPQKFLKRLLGNLGNVFIQLVAVRGIWDTQCGFKAFQNKAAEKIFSVSVIDRWGFDIETLALARHFGFKIGIVLAYWINDEESRVRMSAYLEVLFETIQVRWNLIMGRYEN